MWHWGFMAKCRGRAPQRWSCSYLVSCACPQPTRQSPLSPAHLHHDTSISNRCQPLRCNPSATPQSPRLQRGRLRWPSERATFSFGKPRPEPSVCRCRLSRGLVGARPNFSRGLPANGYRLTPYFFLPLTNSAPSLLKARNCAASSNHFPV